MSTLFEINFLHHIRSPSYIKLAQFCLFLTRSHVHVTRSRVHVTRSRVHVTRSRAIVG